jgi:hydrogenase maturation protease
VSSGVLVVGYGNPLRTDDGIGPMAAQRLADDPRLEGATVLTAHQLLPELALDVSRAALAVLIDVRADAPPASVAIESVEPAPAGDNGTAWSHHLTPTALGSLALELYGAAPEMVVVSIGAASLEVGDRPSAELEAALPRIVDAVVGVVQGRTRARIVEPSHA